MTIAKSHPQLPVSHEQIAGKANRDARHHCEQDKDPAVADIFGFRFIRDPCREYDPAGQRIGGIATGIGVDETGGKGPDHIGVGDQRRDAPIGE